MQKNPNKNVSAYKAADFYMLRAPMLSASVFQQITDTNFQFDSIGAEELDTFIENVHEENYAMLLDFLSQPLIEAAISFASPSLIDGLLRITNKNNLHPRSDHRVERVHLRLLRYLVRMSTRPTPFGLFSGIAVGTFAEKSAIQLASTTTSQIRVRPDMGWLLTLIQEVEVSKNLFSKMYMVVNHTAYIAGHRIIIPIADIYGRHDQRTITFRATPVIHLIFNIAKTPIHYNELYSQILNTFTDIGTEKIQNLLQQLWDAHFLVSDLRPPLIDTDPSTYILKKIPIDISTEPIIHGLTNIINEVSKITSVSNTNLNRLIRQISGKQKQVVSEITSSPLQIDTVLELKEDQLHKNIGEAAAQAAEILLKLSRFPQGYPHLREYYRAFIERYGMEIEVPLLELLSPEVGLDAPLTYKEPLRSITHPQKIQKVDLKAREVFLCNLLVNAINSNQQEVKLTDEHIEALSIRRESEETVLPLSLEIYLQIQATSQKELDRGEWRAVIGTNHGSLGGGRTFGRFFDILGPKSRKKLQEFLQKEEALYPDALFAELSYLPISARAANVSIRPQLRSYEIVVNTTPSMPKENVISLSDLVVGVKNNHFYIRSLHYNKEIIACQSHMLNSESAPNICRFLIEVSEDRYPLLMPFDWGVVSTSPFLPRVVYEKLVLSLAQWNLSRSSIVSTGFGSNLTKWFRGLQQWRQQWHVPRYIYFVQKDNKLLLDLEHPFMLKDLFNEFEKLQDREHMVLQEMYPGFDELWLQDENNASYFTEIVVPVLRRAEVNSKKRMTKKYTSHIVSQQERKEVPGSSWIYFKCYTDIKRHDEIISGSIREIIQKLQQQNLINCWFFIRYMDPRPHIRLRCHAYSDQTKTSLIMTMLEWAKDLTEKGVIFDFCIDTYFREVERYGGPKAIKLMENIFSVDSTVISAFIYYMYSEHLSIDYMDLAVFSLDRFFSDWGLGFSERLYWAKSYIKKSKESEKDFRSRRKTLCGLINSSNKEDDITDTIKIKRHLLNLSASQEEFLKYASSQLHLLAERQELWQSEHDILASLAHMHINRLLGTDQKQERKVMALWLHTLECLAFMPLQ